MTDNESYEHTLYRKMRYAVIETSGRAFFPLELLKDWEKTRLRINPKAKPQDLLKFESVQFDGRSGVDGRVN